jgi:hypothetical protein
MLIVLRCARPRARPYPASGGFALRGGTLVPTTETAAETRAAKIGRYIELSAIETVMFGGFRIDYMQELFEAVQLGSDNVFSSEAGRAL